MPHFRRGRKPLPTGLGLEAAARAQGDALAREEYGPEGFCGQVVRIGDGCEFRCLIAHQPDRAGNLVGKFVTVTVENGVRPDRQV